MEIKRCYDTIIGATVNANQLIKYGNFEDDKGWNVYSGTGTFADNTMTIVGATGRSGVRGSKISIPTGRVCLMRAEIKNTVQIEFNILGTPRLKTSANYANFTPIAFIERKMETLTEIVIDIFPAVTKEVGDFSIRKFQVFDLTAMLGSTIADYLYSLETATAGAGVAKLQEWGFLTDEYIPYNAGSLESVEATAHKMVGFNQFDENILSTFSGVTKDSNGWTATATDWSVDTNVLGWEDVTFIDGASYCATADFKVSETVSNLRIQFNYADGTISYGNFINGSGRSTAVSDASKTIKNVQITFGSGSPTPVTVKSLCINLSSDRNGEYEPYTEQTYDYGNDTLRGIFKLDANNQLYADGDRKTSDGVITRYYGTRAYQSGDESLADAITDGTTTVYKLTTPTTEQGDPFPSPQVCYPDGTEEYVTSNGVPVGHETRYEL